MTAIIFGINGQDGFYLKSILERHQHTVYGVSRSAGNHVAGDVSDYKFVESLVKEHRPDYIFHLAANSSTRHEVLFENHQTISTGAVNILEAVFRYSPQTKVFLSGSGLQFVNTGKPIKETDEFAANNIYAVERIYTTYAARYFRQKGIETYVGYFFHHDSPLRPERHLNMHIIKTGLKIKQGQGGMLEIGNPHVIKEYNFAGDMMEAIWCLVQQNKVYETVIGSGNGHSIMEWINICSEILEVPLNNFVTIRENYKAEFDALVSDPSTIRSLGWKPEYSITTLAQLMVQAAKKG